MRSYGPEPRAGAARAGRLCVLAGSRWSGSQVASGKDAPAQAQPVLRTSHATALRLAELNCRVGLPPLAPYRNVMLSATPPLHARLPTPPPQACYRDPNVCAYGSLKRKERPHRAGSDAITVYEKCMQLYKSLHYWQTVYILSAVLAFGGKHVFYRVLLRGANSGLDATGGIGVPCRRQQHF